MIFLKKICAAIFCVVILIAGCSKTDIANSDFAASTSKVVLSENPASISLSVLPAFGETTGVLDGLPALNEDLVCDWTDISDYLQDYNYQEFPIEGLEKINGLVGFHVYQTPGITFSVRLQSNGNNFDRTFVYAILNNSNNHLKNGIHCGMKIDEAERIINEYTTDYFFLDFSPIVLSDYEETMDIIHFSTLRIDQFPSGMFDQYNFAITVLYQRTPDSIGQALCLYSETGETVDAITSNLYGSS